MAPESALREPDNPWNWDVIFAEVSGELQKEWFPEEGDGEAEVDSNENNSKQSNRHWTIFQRYILDTGITRRVQESSYISVPFS